MNATNTIKNAQVATGIYQGKKQCSRQGKQVVTVIGESLTDAQIYVVELYYYHQKTDKLLKSLLGQID